MSRADAFPAVLLVVGLLFVPGTAWPQCPDPVDQVLVFPANGASGVPRNVVLMAEFPPTRDPRGAPYWLLLDDRGARVEGSALWDGSTSSFTPAAELDARRTYTARVTAQATGDFWQSSFLTGRGADIESPRFGGLEGLSFSYQVEDWLLSTCRLARGDGFLFDLEVQQGTDDASSDDLCYFVYQTKGPGSSERPVARFRAADEDGVLRLFHSVEDEEGEFCFRVEVRDLVGRFDGNSREVCVVAIAGAIFDDACAVAGSGVGDQGLIVLSLLLIGVAASRRWLGR